MSKKGKKLVKSLKKNKTDKFSRLEAKLDLIITNQKQLLSTESKIEKEEKNIENLEKSELVQENLNTQTEQSELAELKKIENLEEELKVDIEKSSPIKKITYKDITKGMIGAFFGVVSHYAFVEGSHLGKDFSLERCILMYIVSFSILVAFLYFSGFRKITDEVKYKFLPLRAIVIYTSAIITAVLVLLLFDTIHFGSDFLEIFKMISPISVLAVLGAATADLIGKNEDD